MSASDLDFQKKTMENYGVGQKKAQASSKLFNFIVQRLENSDKKKTLSREEVSMMLRDGMAKHCFSVY